MYLTFGYTRITLEEVINVRLRQEESQIRVIATSVSVEALRSSYLTNSFGFLLQLSI